MMDKGHCMMAIDNEEEFERFYDFSIAYKDMPKKSEEELKQLEVEWK